MTSRQDKEEDHAYCAKIYAGRNWAKTWGESKLDTVKFPKNSSQWATALSAHQGVPWEILTPEDALPATRPCVGGLHPGWRPSLRQQ